MSGWRSALWHRALATGACRDRLESGLEQAVSTVLAGRVLALDELAVREVVQLTAKREQRGRTVDIGDTFIAGIVRTHGATLATRTPATLTTPASGLSIPGAQAQTDLAMAWGSPDILGMGSWRWTPASPTGSDPEGSSPNEFQAGHRPASHPLIFSGGAPGRSPHLRPR